MQHFSTQPPDVYWPHISYNRRRSKKKEMTNIFNRDNWDYTKFLKIYIFIIFCTCKIDTLYLQEHLVWSALWLLPPAWMFFLRRYVNVVVGDRVLLGWPTVPGWWKDSGASPSRALAASHSPYTCAQTGQVQLFHLLCDVKKKRKKSARRCRTLWSCRLETCTWCRKLRPAPPAETRRWTGPTPLRSSTGGMETATWSQSQFLS